MSARVNKVDKFVLFNDFLSGRFVVVGVISKHTQNEKPKHKDKASRCLDCAMRYSTYPRHESGLRSKWDCVLIKGNSGIVKPLPQVRAETSTLSLHSKEEKS